MSSAKIVSTMKIQRECSPRCNPNAAPGLYTSVNRTHSPMTGCGTRSGCRLATAQIFVAASATAMPINTGQNSRPLSLLCIFLPLLAVDAVARMWQRVQPLECNLVSTLVALAEILRRTIQPAQGFVDVPEKAAFLAGEEERFFALHRVRSLIGHMEGVAAQVSIRRLRRGAKSLV